MTTLIKLTDIIHLLLCKKNHIYDMNKLANRHKEICYYYLEGQIVSEESMPDHVIWEGIVEKFKMVLGFKTDEEALAFVHEVIKISTQVNELTSGNEGRKNFIGEMLR